MYKNSLKLRNIADLQALTPGRVKKNNPVCCKTEVCEAILTYAVEKLEAAIKY